MLSSQWCGNHIRFDETHYENEKLKEEIEELKQERNFFELEFHKTLEHQGNDSEEYEKEIKQLNEEIEELKQELRDKKPVIFQKTYQIQKEEIEKLKEENKKLQEIINQKIHVS